VDIYSVQTQAFSALSSTKLDAIIFRLQSNTST